MRALAAALAFLSLAACASARPTAAPPAQSAAPSPPVGAPLPPAVSLPPAPPPRPEPRGLRLCRAGDLVGRLAGYNGLTGGTAIDYVVLRNVSRTACVVAGTPSFAAFDRAGRPVHLVRSSLDGDFTHNVRRVALLARPARVAWREAEIPISVSGLTEAGQPCPPGGSVDFGRVQVSLPGAGRLSVRVAGVAGNNALGTCEGRFRIGAFIAPDA